MIVRRKGKWCVAHAHPQKGKNDKPAGTIIKCFDTEKEAKAMHTV